MRKLLLAIILALFLTAPAQAADEKINPTAYICAELLASNLDGVPPIFEGLQLDGYAAGQKGGKVADPESMPDMLVQVSEECSNRPADKVLPIWKKLRAEMPLPEDGDWRVDKTTCAAWANNPDDASGFIIWLDGYNRGKTGKTVSVLGEQEILDNFLESCKNSPDSLIIDVLAKNAK